MSDLKVIFDFYIAGFEFDPDDITNISGLTPTEVIKEGFYTDRIGNLAKQENEWSIETPNIAGLDIEEYLENEMFSVFTDEVIGKLQPICNKYVCGLNGYIYLVAEESKPAIIFPKRVLYILSELGGSIALDLYTI